MKIVIRPKAQAEIDDHAEFIAADSQFAASRFLIATQKAFGSIARMPGLGQRWESSNPRLEDVRVWPIPKFRKFLVFYREIQDGIEVLHVFHGSRDIAAILEEE